MALLGCLSPDAGSSGVPLGGRRTGVTFGAPVLLDSPDIGREPSLEIASDGTIYFCSVRGVGQGTNLWRSLDGGETFESLGMRPNAALPPFRSKGGDLGGGDCDLAVDAAGTAYLVDLWLGSVSVASSRDRGETWGGTPISSRSPPVDRPWALGSAADELFVIVDQLANAQDGRVPAHPAGGLWVIRSTDGGVTFPDQILVVSESDRPLWYSNLVETRGAIAFVWEQRLYKEQTGDSEDRLRLVLAKSEDRGRTWTHSTVSEQTFAPDYCFTILVFPSLAADDQGGLFAAWTFENPETGRVDLFMASSADVGETWAAPVQVADRPGTRAFAWIAARDGEVALAWYETSVTTTYDFVPSKATCEWGGGDADEADWYLRYAATNQPHGPSHVFAEAIAQPDPVHNGKLDRPFGELLQVEFGPTGRAGISYVTDADAGPTRPAFVYASP